MVDLGFTNCSTLHELFCLRHSLTKTFLLAWNSNLSEGRFRCCGRTSGEKQLWVGRGYFMLHFHITVHQWGKLGQECKRGTWSLAPKQKPWRSASFWLAPSGWFICFLIDSPRSVIPGAGAAHRELSPPTSLINQENEPQASLVGAFPSVHACYLFQNDSCVKMTSN